MAETPEIARQFLDTLSEGLVSKAEEELRVLATLKAQVEGSSEIHPWDKVVRVCT